MFKNASAKAFFGLVGLVLIVSGATDSAQARVRIDITQGNIEPMPVAIPSFIASGDDQTRSLVRELTSVVSADLARSGLFSVIDERAYIEQMESVNVRPRFADWRIIDAQVLVASWQGLLRIGQRTEPRMHGLRVVCRIRRA